MARNQTANGRSVTGTVGQAFENAGQAVTKAAARTREEAEDVWAEAKQESRKDSGREAAVYVGLAATVVAGALELPIAAAVGAGYALFRRR